jgi:hypothetical protein
MIRTSAAPCITLVLGRSKSTRSFPLTQARVRSVAEFEWDPQKHTGRLFAEAKAVATARVYPVRHDVRTQKRNQRKKMKTRHRSIGVTGHGEGLLRVRSRGIRRWATLTVLALCLTAGAADVTVEFDARITGSNMEGWSVGERMNGYFTYNPDLPPGRQTNSRPILAFGNPGAMNEFYWYEFIVYNNWASDPWNPVALDGITLRFDFMCCSTERYGYLSLTSSNTSLFTNNLLPRTIPPLDRFDRFKGIGITREDVQPYATVSILIERLSVVPGSGLDQPLIFGVQHAPGAVSFRFLTEPSIRYAVQVTDRLPAANWMTLTNIGPTREPTAIINDAAPGLDKRFYRIEKNPN